MTERQPYLYLLIRNDMDSMNSGKAVAHGAHAANQFTHEVGKLLTGEKVDGQLDEDYNQWLASANGFGTTITLHVSRRELQTAVMVAQSINGIVAGETYDPTYPYILHQEYARLINHNTKVDPHTLELEFGGDNKPTPVGNGNMLCLRRELTAGYVFGDKSVAKMVVGNFPLMP